MAAYTSKFLFCVTFDAEANQSLTVKGIDTRSICGATYTTTLPYHVTLVPPFVVANARREKMLDAARVILKDNPRPYIFTTACDFFDSTPDGLAQLVLQVKKTQQLASLHGELLPLLEIYREGGTDEQTLLQRRFGSDFVLNAYNPHISLGSLDAKKLTPDVKNRVTGDFYRSYKNTKITLLEKKETWLQAAVYSHLP